MVTIGSTTLPGVQTEIESAASTGVNTDASAQVALVGQADFVSGTAEANTVYEVTTPVKARTWFGPGSMLAEACVDALTEGAYPVYAVAAEKVAINGEDLSALVGTSGTLNNAPGPEDAEEYVFTIDGTTLTSKLSFGNPSDETAESDTAFVNPVDGRFELNQSVSSSGTVDYAYYDYEAAATVLYDDRADRLDVVGVCNENTDVVDAVHALALQHEQNYEFTVVVAGAGARIDVDAYSTPADSSRLQLLYPSRNADDKTIIGSYVGLRASLGINNSPMWKRLQSQRDLVVTLSKGQQETLVSKKIVPVADESRGARIVEDLTTVADDNAEERSMQQVLHRLIVDYVTEVVRAVSERFIGQLHTQQARNAMQSIISTEMDQLRNLDAITNFVVIVERVDAMTASVDVGIDTVDPLRNILATITAGEVQTPNVETTEAEA